MPRRRTPRVSRRRTRAAGAPQRRHCPARSADGRRVCERGDGRGRRRQQGMCMPSDDSSGVRGRPNSSRRSLCSSSLSSKTDSSSSGIDSSSCGTMVLMLSLSSSSISSPRNCCTGRHRDILPRHISFPLHSAFACCSCRRASAHGMRHLKANTRHGTSRSATRSRVSARRAARLCALSSLASMVYSLMACARYVVSTWTGAFCFSLILCSGCC
ncbi:hypothetical protein DFH11DRAFT_1597541 [Phellopilus nigrolimitatus]|nr:hypothetical protein DFH11DRAFT_1597541 [Phellopilus nigrolimitatus]